MRAVVLALAALALAMTPEAQPTPSAEAVAERLRAAGLLPERMPFGWGAPSTRTELLEAVSLASRPETPGSAGWVVYTGSEALETLAAFTDSLRASGAVSAAVYEAIGARLGSDPQLSFRFSIADAAARLTREEERFAPGAVAPTLDALAALGALTDQERQRLDARLTRGGVRSATAFAAALPAGVFVPDAAPGATAEAAVRAELAAVAAILRQRRIAALPLDAVRVDVLAEPDPYGDLTQYSLDLRVETGGQAYRARSFLDFAREGETPETTRRLHAAVAPVVNKALRDAGAEHRVYAVPMDPYAREWAEPPGTAYVALTEAEATVLAARGYSPEAPGSPLEQPLALVSPHDLLRSDTLTTARTAEALAWLREAGILAGTPDLAGRLDALDRAYVSTPEGLLETLGLIHRFDWEMGDVDTPYLSLVADLAAASGGRFAPEAVESVFDWGARTADLAFTLGGTRYAADLEFNGDWYDGAALRLVDRALRERATPARLYSLVYGRYSDGRPMAGDAFLVLTPAQANALAARGWLELVEWAPYDEGPR